MKHPFQAPLDNLVGYLKDAHYLLSIVEERIAGRAEVRRAAGNTTGAGAPTVEHRALNRAAVVAAVGALEAYCEDLAITGHSLQGSAQTPSGWFTIAGPRGMVQTPNSSKIAKMMWVHFRYDPRPDWDVVLQAAWSELGTGTHWRGTAIRYTHKQAADALDAMVKVRHGFAHQDQTGAPSKTAGIVGVTPTGKPSIQSHHARNAISLVIQLAVQMCHGLDRALNRNSGASLRWKAAMEWSGWIPLLEGTPAAAEIQAEWTHQPFS